MIDVMIDLETTDTAPTAKILSLGAVKFDRLSGEIDHFYVRFDVSKMPGTTSADTMAWWQKQHMAVRQEAFGGKALPEDLKDFCKWLGGSVMPWGNGSHFDITILENTLNALGIPIPWKFWNVRDLRTLADLSGLNPRQFTFDGAKHNALADAQHQVRYAVEMFKAILSR